MIGFLAYLTIGAILFAVCGTAEKMSVGVDKLYQEYLDDVGGSSYSVVSYELFSSFLVGLLFIVFIFLWPISVAMKIKKIVVGQ